MGPRNVNEKVAEARNRKASAKQQAAAAAEAAKERQREEAAKKKAEAKRLAAEEEAALAAASKKSANKAAASKLTAHQLAQQRERDLAEQQRLAEQRSLETKRMVSADEYAAAIEVQNRNREEGVVEAHGIEAAIEVLSLDGQPADRHPEKRAKAAFKDYYDAELPLLKQEKPGLRLMQYKSILFERWQRDPRNPRNQVDSK